MATTQAAIPQLTKGNVFSVFNLFSLALLSSACHMFGEFFREGAVLLMVFVPLEIWKSQSSLVNFQLIVEVSLSSLFVLAVGMALEWTSLLATRIKRDLEISYEGS